MQPKPTKAKREMFREIEAELGFWRVGPKLRVVFGVRPTIPPDGGCAGLMGDPGLREQTRLPLA